jgi:hypothetical protein
VLVDILQGLADAPETKEETHVRIPRVFWWESGTRLAAHRVEGRIVSLAEMRDVLVRGHGRKVFARRGVCKVDDTNPDLTPFAMRFDGLGAGSDTPIVGASAAASRAILVMLLLALLEMLTLGQERCVVIVILVIASVRGCLFRLEVLVLDLLVAIVYEQQAASIEPESVQARNDRRESMKLVNEAWDVLGQQAGTVVEETFQDVGKLVLLDLATFVLVLRDKGVAYVIPDLKKTIRRQPSRDLGA